MAAKTTNDNGTQGFDFTSNDSVNSILQSEKQRWKPISGNQITYSFLNDQSVPLYPKQYDDDDPKKLEEDVSPLSSTVEGYVKDIFEKVFGSVIAVNFQSKIETVKTNKDKVQETTDFGTLRIMSRAFAQPDPNRTTLGRGKFPGTDSIAGDLYLNNNVIYSIGTLGYATILHELGHTLGLKHPFDTSGTTLDRAKDNNTYTVMTYNANGSIYSANSDGQAVSLMPYDIQALQHLYGARVKNSDDTTYVFRDVDHYSVNGTDYYTFASGNSENTFGHSKSTLWDSGGVDTLDFSGITAFPTLIGKNGFDYRFDMSQGGTLTEYSSYEGATYQAYDPNYEVEEEDPVTKEKKKVNKPDWKGGEYKTLKFGTVLAFSPIDNPNNSGSSD